jgi:hypothetical protein
MIFSNRKSPPGTSIAVQSATEAIMAKQQDSGNAQRTSGQSGGGPHDFEKVGPTSIEGVEASDLPDKGRGDVFSDPGKEAGRKLPQQTGQWESGDAGLRAEIPKSKPLPGDN